MKILLAQHGEAVTREEDPDRPLTPQGRKDVERTAAFLRDAGITAMRVLHSGKTRARQTAEILARSLHTVSDPEIRHGIGPGDAVEPLLRDIARWDEDTLVVGHLPFMALLTSQLVTGQDAVGISAYRPGTITCLEKNSAGHWIIAWMVRPELLGAPRRA
ncbi:MAG: phosphohistidine phosphatase SixA [Gammaproteobacteria bacterium]